MQGTNHPPQANTKYLPRYQTRQRILVEIVVLIFAAGSLALGIAYSVQLYQAPWNPLDIGYLQGRNVWRDEGVPFLYCTSAIITLILSIASLILYARKWSRMIHIPLASAILQICGWVISMGLWGNCHFGIKYDDWDDLGIRSKYPDCFFNPNATCVDYQGYCFHKHLIFHSGGSPARFKGVSDGVAYAMLIFGILVVLTFLAYISISITDIRTAKHASPSKVASVEQQVSGRRESEPVELPNRVPQHPELHQEEIRQLDGTQRPVEAGSGKGKDKMPARPSTR